MLVLSRQRDQSVIFDFSKLTDADWQKLRSGEQVIEETVVDIRGDKVRLGHDAPRSVQVHRKEIWRQIRRETAAAEESKAPALCRGCQCAIAAGEGGVILNGQPYHAACVPAGTV
jgi:carbon storage regulator